MSRPNYITATGNIGDDNGGTITYVVLTPAAALSTLVLREGGSGGTIIASYQAAASGSSFFADLDDCDGGMVYAGQLHATLSGSGAAANVGL